jgi:hypothetical protein
MDEVNIDMNVSVNEDHPEQVLPSQVEEMDIEDEDHGDVDMIDSDSNSDVIVVRFGEYFEDHVDEIVIVIDSDSYSDVIEVGIGSDSDSDVDAEHDEDRGDVINSDYNSDVIVVGIGSDSDSNVGSEYDEDVIKPLSAHDYEMFNNFDELPFCVSQKDERGNMHKKPEKKDMVDDINPEGGYDNKKTVDV